MLDAPSIKIVAPFEEVPLQIAPIDIVLPSAPQVSFSKEQKPAPTALEWLQQIQSMSSEKSFAKDILMHSRLLESERGLVLYYAPSLSCLLTSTVEQRIRKLVSEFGYDVSVMPIQSADISETPYALLEAALNQEKIAAKRAFFESVLGQYLQSEPDLWVDQSNPL